MSGYVKAGESFLKNLLKGGKSSGSGKAIKNIGPNVPKSELDKLTRDVKILEQKTKATKAMLDQGAFEIKNPQFTKGRFTFDPNRRNVKKKSEKKAKGGRVGLKRGTFPDLNKDGKTTFADVLIGRGVLPKGKKKKTMAKKSESPMDKAVKKKNKKRFV